jgi:site-specific recombinase XerD
VLTVMDWAADAVAEWVEEIRPHYADCGNAMWPTERQARISTGSMNDRFRAYRDAIGLDPTLGPHCLRHSYATHLLEDGFDHLFVQQQLGHAWGASTAIYSSVGADYKNQALRRALARAFELTRRLMRPSTSTHRCRRAPPTRTWSLPATRGCSRPNTDHSWLHPPPSSRP